MISNKNKYNVFNWVKKVINSCDTKEQFYVSLRLYNNFKRNYNITGEMREEMMECINSKRKILIYEN